MASNLVTRVAIGLPLAGLVLYFTSLRRSEPIMAASYFGLVMCWLEFLPLVLPSRVPKLFYYGGLAVLSVLYFIGIYASGFFMVALSIAVGIMFMINLRDYVAALRSGNSLEAYQRIIPIVAAPMGVIYALTLVMYLPKIHMLDRGNVLLGLFFCGVWACDVGAYFTGRAIGKRPLSPEISPKKTWEGLCGGTVFTACWILLFKYTFASGLIEWVDVAVLTIILGPTSQLGDLAESLIKRTVDKKDAGKILPGHGGVLDRIDGYLISAPLFYLYCTLRFAEGLNR